MRLFFILTAWLGALASLSAQIKVEIAFPQEQYLPGEQLQAYVRISNLSGQPITLGKEADWLTFSIVSKEGYVVEKSGEADVLGEFTLESSQSTTKRVDLAPYFNTSKMGGYSATATVKVPGWQDQFTSTQGAYDIVTGLRIWEREFGVPPAMGGSGQPEMRKYILMQANFLKHLRLYLQISDASESKMFRVFALGPMISVSKPEAQVDKFGNLHTIYQNGPRSFGYFVINPEGRVVIRETHDIVGTRPRMFTEAGGKIVIRGGARRPLASDLPTAPPASAESSPDSTTVTNATPFSVLNPPIELRKPQLDPPYKPVPVR